MLELSLIQQIAVWVLPVLFAITLHEAAHAFVAYRLGDTTAKMLGRLSFNPIKHIDLIGSILVPIITLVLSQASFVFGWAKPVPINASNFSNPRRDLALATAAGPLSNIVMALIWASIYKLMILLNSTVTMIGVFIILTAKAGILINVILAIFNLLPIPPLDGSRIVMGFLSVKQAIAYQKIEPFGFIILLTLLFTGLLKWVVSPPINWLLVMIKTMFNL